MTEERDDSNKKPKPKPKNKLSGPIFWIILILAIFKDIFDALADFTVIFSILSLITGPFFTFILFTYYFMTGVSASDKKITTWVATSVISVIPLVNFLPETTVNLLVTRMLENNETLKKASSLKSGKTIIKETV